MKTITAIIIFLFNSFSCLAQFTNCKVADADTKQPLFYATIYYGKLPAITFSDSLGTFFIRNEILHESDSVRIEFIGYATLTVPIKNIVEGKQFFLKKKNIVLQDVVVKNCKEYEEKEIDCKYGKMHTHWTSFVQNGNFIGYYKNEQNIFGYLSKIKFHVQNIPFIHQNLSIPLRLRWYEWNEKTQMPGQELTDTSLLIYAYKKGWNTISIPDKTIYFDKNGIVLGIEFLYPSSLEKEAALIPDLKKRRAFLSNYAIHIGMAKDDTKNQGFVKVKDAIIRFDFDSTFIKPALNFTIKVCK